VDKSTRRHKIYIGGGRRRLTDPPSTGYEILEKGGRFPVRCGVCRSRDWDRGGTGDAPLLGYLTATEGEGVDFLVTFRRGGHYRALQARLFETAIEQTPKHSGGYLLGGLTDNGIEVRCRHGHDLRVSLERLGKLLDRPLPLNNTLYLPGS
jgi:hypothetical protein